MEFTTRFELQSQATRLVENGPYARRNLGARTGLSPSLMLFSKRLRPHRRLASPLQTTIRTRESDLQRELFPLHSPLLGASWLVSFPPLSYMLKFSGSSCLIGGPNESTSIVGAAVAAAAAVPFVPSEGQAEGHVAQRTFGMSRRIACPRTRAPSTTPCDETFHRFAGRVSVIRRTRKHLS